MPNEGKDPCPKGYQLDLAARQVAYKKYHWVVGDIGEKLEESGLSSNQIYGKIHWDIGTIGALTSDLLCFENYHGSLPSIMKPQLWERVKRFTHFKFHMDFLDKRLVRLKGEMSAREILQGIDNFVSGNPYRRKFRLLSGHDTGLYPHTIMLNLTDLDCNIDMV